MNSVAKNIPKVCIGLFTFFLFLFLQSCSEDPVGESQDDNQKSTRDVPADAIPGIAYLGTGYDAFGQYASTKAIKAPILDFEKYNDVTALGEVYQIPRDVSYLNLSDYDYQSIYGRYASEYLSSRSQTVSLSASYGGFFSSTVKTNFSEEKYRSTDYAFCTVTRTILYWRLTLPFTDIDKIKDMMLGQAREDINTLDPILLFNKYGTHLTTELHIGARADYHCEIEKNEETSKIKTKVAATADASFKKFSGSVEYDASFEEDVSTFRSNSTTKIKVSGGRPELGVLISDLNDFEEWLDSVSENPVLCDFTENSLIPIWDLCDDEARKQELLAALEEYAGTQELPAIIKTIVADIKVIISGTGNYEPLVDFGYTIIPTDLNYDAGGNYVWFEYKDSLDGGTAIDSIGFLVNSQPTPQGWTKLPQDLNSGVSGSDFIYICYKKAQQPANPIRRLMVTFNNQEIPDDFEVGRNLVTGNQQDLAQDTGNGVYIYLSYSREKPLEDEWGD